ncbi:UvrD-helicase domain-containing protein [Rhodobacterales bacterium HKCCE3408]|nr:UvrD-helicase domain-containing protein [Rhodobacterales bacterium HKCCE3408]
MSSFDESDAFEAASLSVRAMAARPAPYLDGLNPAQREAVETLNGPVLMLAGAGTGKTRALTARIAHLLATGQARPNEILAVTFTNKAAREMRNRIGGFMGHAVEGMPWLGTFHAICVKLLRRHAELVDLKSNFTILDTDDQTRLMKQLIIAANIDEKRWPARMLAGIIDTWKNRAWTPEKVPEREKDAFDGKGVMLYAEYQDRLRTLNAVDFGDLLLHVIRIFQENADLLEQYQRWFRYILVDEYQDTNVAQYLWLRLLAQSHSNICVVGDDDQSIYGWRGAEVGNILRFEKDFPGAKVIRLEQNYRSTGHILAAASGVISANKGRLGKTLWTEDDDGEKVRLIGHWDGEEEARWIGEEIEDAQAGRGRFRDRVNVRSISLQQETDRLSKGGAVSKHREGDIHKVNLARSQTLSEEGKHNFPIPHGFELDEIAILVRASHQMRAFEDRFLTIGLPYRVIGGPRFYERMEIRDAMAYFRLVVSPEDDLAFERIVNVPKRGLGEKAQATIQQTARQHGVSLTEGAQILIDEGGIGGKGAKELQKLLDQLQRWARMAHGPLRQVGPSDDLIEEDGARGMSHVELAEIILDESGYTAHWQNDKTPEAPGRLENLKELVKALEEFENLQGFLEHVSLIMDNETEDGVPKVTLMTLHAAKGLEFPAVFLPGWEDGLFPSQRAMDGEGLKGLEEERRLAYVGITRAEEVCTISFAGNRRVYGQWQSQMPSRFIDELPAEHVEVLTPPGLYGHGGGMSAAASPVDGMMRGSDLHDRAARADVYNSPGWKRLQANQGARHLRQPQEARNMVIDAEAVALHDIGARVFHQKFGYGEVVEVEGDKLSVEFEKAGTKKVVARYVVAADAAGDVPF